MKWSDLSPAQKVEAIRGGLAMGETQSQIARRLGTSIGAVAGCLHYHPEAREVGPMLVGGGAGRALVRIRPAAGKAMPPAPSPEPTVHKTAHPVAVAAPVPAPREPKVRQTRTAMLAGRAPAAAAVVAVAAPSAPSPSATARATAAEIAKGRFLLLSEIVDGFCRWPLWPHQGRTPPAEQFVCSESCALEEPYCAVHTATATRRRDQIEP